MNNRLSFPYSYALRGLWAGIVWALTVLAPPASAQAPSATAVLRDTNRSMRLNQLEGQGVYTPEYDVSTRGAGQIPSYKEEQEWFVVECIFDTLPEWLDDVVFTYYVRTKARRATDVEAFGGNQYNILRGRVTHTNIPSGKRHRSSMYLKPMSYLRFGEVESIAVEVEWGDEKLTLTEGEGQGRPWWTQGTPIEGHLLPKNITPFAYYEYDQYVEIKDQ